MTRHDKQGIPRAQQALLPARIEDYVRENNRVRAIDAFLDTLDLADLGLQNASGALTPGQPAFAPADLLKLYIYGYIERLNSSRRLENACRRNLEVIWLLGGLVPSYRTIAEFRRINGKALRAASRQFVQICKELGLLGGKTVAIDGSYFNASASDASILTKNRLESDLKQIEREIDSYHQLMDTTDAEEASQGDVFASDIPALNDKLGALKERQARKQAQLKQLNDSGETQLSRTDPDARVLTKGKQPTVGYNVQSSVDSRHKLILNEEVTNAGNDRSGQPRLPAQCLSQRACHLGPPPSASAWPPKDLSGCASAPRWSSIPSAPSNAGSAGITSWCVASRKSKAR